MEIKQYIDLCISVMKIQFTLMGFTLSVWQILLYFLIAGCLLLLLGGLLR